MPFEYVFRNRVPRISTIKRDLVRADIPFQTDAGRVDLHSLRVTFCMNLLNAGVHARVVQELMRHSDIKLTMKNYTDVSQLPTAAALEKLPVLAVADREKERIHICAHGVVTNGQDGASVVSAVHSGEILQSL